MNKRQVIASLNKIANELDSNGLFAEASTVTKVMSRLASDDYAREYFKQNPDAPRGSYGNNSAVSYEMEPELRGDVMQMSDIMDPQGTSNRVDDLYSRHNSIVEALDDAESEIMKDDSISEDAKMEFMRIKERLQELIKQL